MSVLVQSVQLKKLCSCSEAVSGHTCLALAVGLTVLISGLYAGVKNMWSDCPRCGRGDALNPCLMLLYTYIYYVHGQVCFFLLWDSGHKLLYFSYACACVALNR